jgi:hypothetical protein
MKGKNAKRKGEKLEALEVIIRGDGRIPLRT